MAVLEFHETLTPFDPGSEASEAALARRLVRALARVQAVGGGSALVDALAEPSDIGSLVSTLAAALPLFAAERELDPALDMRVGSLVAEQRLIERAGGLRDTDWVASFLRIEARSVAAKARRGELLAIRRGDRNFYPAFQFRNGGVIPAIRAVLGVLPLQDGWSRLSFLLTEDPGLDGRTPVEAYDADRESVLAVATTLGEQGGA
jgi:hypothetical protein